MTETTVFHTARAFVDGAFEPAAVVVSGERVVSVEPRGARVDGAEHVHLPEQTMLLPGLVDTHVHVNEPGRTPWEGFETATRAAAAGGVTTLLDMPLNSIPPTISTGALEVKRRAAEGKLHVDVGFWGGVVPANLGGLRPLWDAGVFGFKCFLSPSGVEEFPSLSVGELREALREVAEFDGLLIVHAEDPEWLVGHDRLGRRYADFLATRPPRSEESAIAHVIEGARETGARVHILHVSDAGALPMIREAKAAGVRVTAETCPHYLTMRAEDIPEGATEFKCCPPIRDSRNQDRLWEGVLDGTIDAVVSDHSPTLPDLKRRDGGDFGSAWGGISGLQLGFRATAVAARDRGVPLERILPLFTTGPVRVSGLRDRGRIAPGARADLVVFDPVIETRVRVGQLEHRNPVSAYDGRTVLGRIVSTWLRGRRVYGAADGFGPVAGGEEWRPSTVVGTDAR